MKKLQDNKARYRELYNIQNNAQYETHKNYSNLKYRNPNNTGSLWCARNAKNWATTTHFEYYANDPQCHTSIIGGIVDIIGKYLLLVLAIAICCAFPVKVAIVIAVVLGGLYAFVLLIKLYDHIIEIRLPQSHWL